MGIAFTLSMSLPPPLPFVSFVSAQPSLFFFNKLFWKCGISDARVRACVCANMCFSLQFLLTAVSLMMAFLVYVCKHPLPSCFPSPPPPLVLLSFSSPSSSLLTPPCLRTLGDICLTSCTNPPSLHTHTHAGSPSLRSGSAAEKVTGWATIKRVRARRSFVIATRDADGELLSSVNDKSMKFPSCSHHEYTHTHNCSHTHTHTHGRGY